MQVLCHKPSSRSLDSLIHEVLQFSYFNHFLAGITTGFLLLLTFLAVDLPRSLNNFCYVWDYCSHQNQQLLFYYFLMHFSVVTNILLCTSKPNNLYEWNQNVWAISALTSLAPVCIYMKEGMLAIQIPLTSSDRKRIPGKIMKGLIHWTKNIQAKGSF